MSVFSFGVAVSTYSQVCRPALSFSDLSQGWLPELPELTNFHIASEPVQLDATRSKCLLSSAMPAQMALPLALLLSTTLQFAPRPPVLERLRSIATKVLARRPDLPHRSLPQLGLCYLAYVQPYAGKPSVKQCSRWW